MSKVKIKGKLMKAFEIYFASLIWNTDTSHFEDLDISADEMEEIKVRLMKKMCKRSFITINTISEAIEQVGKYE